MRDILDGLRLTFIALGVIAGMLILCAIASHGLLLLVGGKP